MLAPTELLEKDQAHFLHPLHHPSTTQAPLIFESGHGIWLKTVEGKEYIDGLAGLWNVLIGHGNTELADAARDQIATLAYCSSYAGTSNLPAIELADRLAGLAYPSLNTTFFSSGGAESNESAFKTVRYYWRRLGKPDKTKVISRINGYHGITLAAMSATGMSVYWPMFEPRVPGFLHIPAPYPFRFPADQIREGETIGLAAARARSKRPSCAKGQRPSGPLLPSQFRERAVSLCHPMTTFPPSAPSVTSMKCYLLPTR